MDAPNPRWTGGIILAALPPLSGDPSADCMPLDRLVETTGLPRERVTRLIESLSRRGLVCLPRHACYRRTASGEAALECGKLKSGPKGSHGKVRAGGIHDKIWRALRIERRATIPQLLELIDHGLKFPEDAAQRYLRRLGKAGVTHTTRRRVAGDAQSSPGFLQFVLVRDLGPQAPQWRAVHQRLWDPNAKRWADEDGS